jgi:hypothetical protein
MPEKVRTGFEIIVDLAFHSETVLTSAERVNPEHRANSDASLKRAGCVRDALPSLQLKA